MGSVERRYKQLTRRYMGMCKCEKCGEWVPLCIKLIEGCEWCTTTDIPHINPSRDNVD